MKPLSGNEQAMIAAADTIRRSNTRTRHLVQNAGGDWGVPGWLTLDEAEQAAWLSLAVRATQAAEAAEEE